jgi:asparagine synthetase B (glutamine-hydrolysing)
MVKSRQDKQVEDLQVVQIKLNEMDLLHFSGFDSHNSITDKRIIYASQVVNADSTILIKGVFYDAMSVEILESKLITTSIDDTYLDSLTKIEGDYNIIVINKKQKEVLVYASRSGLNRLYYNINDGVLLLTNTINDQIKHQKTPRFSDYGVYTVLTMGYFKDPNTMLKDTWSTGMGEALLVDNGGRIKRRELYNPVTIDAKKFESINESVDNLDKSLKEYFQSRIDPTKKPLVFLSGGIDSLVLMAYLKEIKGVDLDSLTFAFENATRDELPEAMIAAKYFNSNHKELIIKEDDIYDFTLESLVNMDYFQLGSAGGIAIKKWILQKEASTFDIYRGEDTRLHTPFLDLPTKLGFYFTLQKQQKNVKAKLVNIFTTLNLWKFKFGKNYIKYFLKKIQPEENVQLFLLKNCLRFNLPIQDKGKNFQKLLEETKNLKESLNLDQAHRNVIKEAFKIQYSDDVQGSVMMSAINGNSLNMPFMDSKVVKACNDIPYSHSSKSKFVSPSKTRSPFFLSDKIILRKLLKNRVPEELLFRRKTTAPNDELIYQKCWTNLYFPLISRYSNDLIDCFEDGETKELLKYYCQRLIKSNQENIGLLWQANIISVLIIRLLLINKTIDGYSTLKTLLKEETEKL